eukprot:7740509-Pyramimonas_sp.AAC.1
MLGRGVRIPSGHLHGRRLRARVCGDPEDRAWRPPVARPRPRHVLAQRQHGQDAAGLVGWAHYDVDDDDDDGGWRRDHDEDDDDDADSCERATLSQRTDENPEGDQTIQSVYDANCCLARCAQLAALAVFHG